jgi:cation diffusion facilitator family transporter
MKEEKPIVVYVAIAANLAIGAMKFVVSFITGSSAMLAEAIHSTADSGNELLLLLGIKRSKKPADEEHPLGHGRELYFWSLIVAIVLFGAGAGMSIYEGITSLSQSGEMKNVGWNYAVLGFAFLADGTSWITAFRQLRKQKKDKETFWHSIRTSKDPSVFIIFGEDTADVAGLFVAFLGVFLGQQLHSRLPDVIASILVGLILAVIAFYLIYESKSLLIGEAADPEIIARVQKMVHNHPAVEKVQVPLTVQLSPEEVFLALDVQFKPDLQAAELVKVIDELEAEIHQEQQSIGKIFIEVERLKGSDGKQHST